MMVAAQVFDFHLQDLTRPQSKRFKRDLCALINFFRFRSDRLAEFDELVVGTEELVDRYAVIASSPEAPSLSRPESTTPTTREP